MMIIEKVRKTKLKKKKYNETFRKKIKKSGATLVK
jgi:hypothetical protein